MNRSADELINHCAQVAFSISLNFPTNTNTNTSNNHISDRHFDQQNGDTNSNYIPVGEEPIEQIKNIKHSDLSSAATSTLGEEDEEEEECSSALTSLNMSSIIPLAKQLALLPEIYAIIESLLAEGNVDIDNNNVSAHVPEHEQTNLDE